MEGKGFSESGREWETDKSRFIVRNEITTTCAFLCFTTKARLKMNFPSIIGKYVSSPTKKSKLHCDVYLNIIRQNDLVDISVSVWTVAFPCGEEIKIFCLFFQRCAKWSGRELDKEIMQLTMEPSGVDWTQLTHRLIHCFLIVAQKPCILYNPLLSNNQSRMYHEPQRTARHHRYARATTQGQSSPQKLIKSHVQWKARLENISNDKKVFFIFFWLGENFFFLIFFCYKTSSFFLFIWINLILTKQAVPSINFNHCSCLLPAVWASRTPRRILERSWGDPRATCGWWPDGTASSGSAASRSSPARSPRSTRRHYPPTRWKPETFRPTKLNWDEEEVSALIKSDPVGGEVWMQFSYRDWRQRSTRWHFSAPEPARRTPKD